MRDLARPYTPVALAAWDRARTPLTLAAWAAAWVALAVLLWLLLASLAFLALEGRFHDPSIPALRRPVAWWHYASRWTARMRIDQGMNLAVAAAAGLVPHAVAAKLWWRRSGGARGVAQRMLGLYLIHRVASHNFGDADWEPLDSRTTLKLLPPHPDPKIGGIALLEQVRMDLTPVGDVPFDPDDEETWGPGGKAPILFEHCRTGSTHGLLLMSSGGFKTMQMVTTLAHWRTGAFVFDPSQEIAGMTAEWRREMGSRPIVLEPGSGKGINALKWIDTRAPLAQVALVVSARRTYGKTDPKPGQDEGSAAYFREQGLNLYTAVLGHLLWHPDLPPECKTYRAAREILTWPEDELRGFLREIYESSACKLARDFAGPLFDLVKVTFDGIRSNAQQGTAWLSIDAFADLVSGDDYDLEEMCDGATVYCQIGMDEMEAMPEVGRAVISAALNTVMRRKGRVTGRVWCFIDEADLPGPMAIFKTVRTRGRKYRLSLTMAYLSESVMEEVWGQSGAKAWFEGVTWFQFGPTQSIGQAETISRWLGSYGAQTVSTSYSKGTSGRPMELGTGSKGENTTYGEMERALLKPQEIRRLRADERILFHSGRIWRGRAPIAFCRPELRDRIGETSFNAEIKARRREERLLHDAAEAA
jgi:type IV secretion system protein VirD4